MQEHHSNLWDYLNAPGHLICISTNGFVKRNGAAVMGRGCALQATKIDLGIPMVLGRYIRENGNVPGILHGNKYALGILPVKHKWWERADMELIQRSINWLVIKALDQSERIFHVPRLGCGNGGRNWPTEVRPLMEILPENVWVHS